MKIKKGDKTWFFISLIATIGLFGLMIYQIINGEFSKLSWYEILLNVFMLIVMTSTTIKFIEFKK